MNLHTTLQRVLAEFDEKRLFQAAHCGDCLQILKAFISQSLTESLKEAFAFIKENRFEDSEDVDSVSFLTGEIHTADYKKGYRAALQAIEDKKKNYYGDIL